LFGLERFLSLFQTVLPKNASSYKNQQILSVQQKMFLDRINGILQDNLFSYFDSFRKKLSKLNPALPEMVLI